MLNDACVLAGKPLVSGSAVGLEGQLTVYNYAGGPCYRCVYPTPMPATAARACSDAGVLGPVPAVIGNLQVRRPKTNEPYVLPFAQHARFVVKRCDSRVAN